MRVINFSDVKSQLNQVVDQVVYDGDFTVIVRRYAPSSAVMSLDTFNSLMETLQLMKSSANIKYLEKSIAQYRILHIKSKG
jgi:antitoxin YefM